MSLEYEPSSKPLHISAKKLGLGRIVSVKLLNPAPQTLHPPPLSREGWGVRRAEPLTPHKLGGGGAHALQAGFAGAGRVEQWAPAISQGAGALRIVGVREGHGRIASVKLLYYSQA